METESEEEKEIGVTVGKEEDFSEWYTQVIRKSDMADYSPVSGFMVVKPWAYSIWEKVYRYLDEELKSLGVQNAYFPLLIPEKLLVKEAEHFAGFTPEVAWVTHSGTTELGERLAIRPTSETIIYSSISDWISSYKDLPLRLNMWNSVVRMEFKDPKLFLRTKEFLWQEGHTCFRTKDEAVEETADILSLYKEVIEDLLAIPTLTGKKSESEKFAGAEFTNTAESLMPDGKVLQMGTTHHLGQNFTRPFEVTYTDSDGERRFPYSNSWGASTRLLGALIMVHGDDRGLVLPPRVAPHQVVIVPIYYGDEEKEGVLSQVEEFERELAEEDVRAHSDVRERYTPGWKFNHWELKGVPLRVEIGPRDVRQGQVVLVRRDTHESVDVPREEAVEKTKNTLEDIQTSLFQKAEMFLEENIHEPGSYEEFKEELERHGGMFKVSWCGAVECEEEVKEETGATCRLIPFDDKESSGGCVFCDRPASVVAFFAKSY